MIEYNAKIDTHTYTLHEHEESRWQLAHIRTTTKIGMGLH